MLSANVRAQLVLDKSINLGIGSLCGIAHSASAGEIWVYDCSSTEIKHFDTTGVLINSFPFPGEAANDVDLEIAPENFMLDTINVQAGQLLVINGETAVAEIYVLDQNTGSVLGVFNTQFGVSHVVGGAYHPINHTFFLIQDGVPSAPDENLIAEIDLTSGAVLDTTSTTSTFAINFGDLDVSNPLGNLFLVSSSQTSIGEFTSSGAFVQTLPLPANVSSLSGISLNCETGKAWVSSNNGNIYFLSGFNCGGLGVGEFTLSKINVFPNPSHGNITIELGKKHETISLQITNILGQDLFSQTYEAVETIPVEITGPSGMYFLTINVKGNSITKKVVKY